MNNPKRKWNMLFQRGSPNHPPGKLHIESRALNLSKNQVGRPAFFVSTDFEQITRDTLIYTTDWQIRISWSEVFSKGCDTTSLCVILWSTEVSTEQRLQMAWQHSPTTWQYDPSTMAAMLLCGWRITWQLPDALSTLYDGHSAETAENTEAIERI